MSGGSEEADDARVELRRGWIAPAIAAALGLSSGYIAAAYPFDRGEYVLPNLRKQIAEAGEPSPMDDLYNRSVLACGAMLDQPTLETDGGQLRALTGRKLSEFMDDWKIVGTNERQFAAVICRTYLDGRMNGLQDKPMGLWVSRPGTYDGPYQ